MRCWVLANIWLSAHEERKWDAMRDAMRETIEDTREWERALDRDERRDERFILHKLLCFGRIFSIQWT
jgi:hypothetical protein